jgi:hypothetical protein
MELLIGTPPAGREPGGHLVVCGRGLHSRGEEQGADRHPALQAGVHLARGMDPVRQLTGTDERGGEDDLAGEETVGGGRSEQPQWGFHSRHGRFSLLPCISSSKFEVELQADSCQ